MSHIIINSPSVYTCKLPSRGWINLALIRQIEYDDFNYIPIAIVVWSNGDKQIFRNDDAKALIDSWNSATKLLEQRCNHRQRSSEVLIMSKSLQPCDNPDYPDYVLIHKHSTAGKYFYLG